MLTLLLQSALVIFIFMNVMFIIALILKDNSIVDIGWGLGFVSLASFHYFNNTGINSTAQTYILIMIALWGLRLATYIFIRNAGKGEDYRYKQWREEWGKNVVWRSYLQVFMLQGTIMLLVSLPILIVMSQVEVSFNSTTTYSAFQIIGITFFAIGLLFETHSDWHLYFFKLNPLNKGRIMRYGLWSITRHPNYFGEALLWWGIFIFSIPSGYWYISLISPFLISFLLVRVSGVAMLEKKYANNTEYQDYIKNTASFIPWIW